MGKIVVLGLGGGESGGWDKLVEQDITISGSVSSSSDSSTGYTSIPIDPTGYDMLFLELSGTITLTSGTYASVATGTLGSTFLSTTVPGPFRAVLLGNGTGQFYQAAATNGRNMAFSTTIGLCLVGRQFSGSFRGTIRVCGKKIVT